MTLRSQRVVPFLTYLLLKLNPNIDKHRYEKIFDIPITNTNERTWSFYTLCIKPTAPRHTTMLTASVKKNSTTHSFTHVISVRLSKNLAKDGILAKGGRFTLSLETRIPLPWRLLGYAGRWCDYQNQKISKFFDNLDKSAQWLLH